MLGQKTTTKLVEDMLMQHQKLGCNRPLCLYRFASFIPLWIFSLTTMVWLLVSDEYGEYFHEVMANIEQR